MDPKRTIRQKNALRAETRREAKTLPIHMIKRDTHDLFKKNIENNKKINTLLESINFNSRYEILLLEINSLIPSEFEYNYCISGSKSWNNIFKDYYDSNLLSEYEKSAIHFNNSCDHYYFINNNTQPFIEYITGNIKTLLDNFILSINQDLNTNVKLLFNDTNKQINLSISISDKLANKLLFNENTYSFSLGLTITDDVPLPNQQNVFQQILPYNAPAPTKSKKPRAKRITTTQIAEELEKERKEKEAVKNAAASSRAARAARLEEKRSEAKRGGGNEHKATILIFEINFRDIGDTLKDKINVLKMKDNNFLNVYGIFLFLQFAKFKFYKKRDQYNVFKIREHIYNKFILLDEYKTNTLFTILNMYNSIFKEYKLSKDYLNNELYILALTSNPEIKKYIADIEVIIIEKLRPYINKVIFDINNNIKSITFKNNFNIDKDGEDYSGIFVVGGDAIRRYDNEGSITKDIDAKIYIPAELDIKTNIENYKKINKCICDNLFKLLSYVILDTEILSSIQTTVLEKVFDATSDNDYKCKVSFKLQSDNPDVLNFKFRQLPGNSFPVDLYSLDYNCVINFEYELPSGEKATYIHTYTIAFIDIVLEISQDNNYKKYGVISNNLPIGNIDFLIQDLINTYNNDTSSLLRFINGKNNKDYERFKLLINIAKHKDKNFTINDESKIITYINQTTIYNNLILDKIENYKREIINNSKYNKLMTLFENNYNYNHDDNYRVNKKILFDYEKSALMRKSELFQRKKGTRGGSGSKNKNYVFNNYVDFGYIDKILNITNDVNNEIIDDISKKPTDNDKYIFNIMSPENEISESKQKKLLNIIMKK